MTQAIARQFNRRGTPLAEPHRGALQHGPRHPSAAPPQNAAKTNPVGKDIGPARVPEVATDLGVSVNWVSGRIRRGVIRIDRDPDTGRYLFPDTDKTMAALRQLRAGASRALI